MGIYAAGDCALDDVSSNALQDVDLPPLDGNRRVDRCAARVKVSGDALLLWTGWERESNSSKHVLGQPKPGHANSPRLILRAKLLGRMSPC